MIDHHDVTYIIYPLGCGDRLICLPLIATMAVTGSNDSPSTGAAASASSSASAILDKFNQLHRSIDDVRSDISRIQLETEQAHDAIHKLHAERDTLVVQTRVAEEERVALQPQVTEALEECDKVQQEHSQSVLEKQRVQQQLKRTKAVMEEERQAFLTQSRNFRTWCRHMQEKESMMMTTRGDGFDNEKKDVSFVKAYSYVRRFQQPLEGDDTDNNNAADRNTIRDSNNVEDDNNMDSWLMNETDDDDDEEEEDAHDSELQHAKSLFRSRQQAFNKTRLCVKDMTAQYEAKVEQENQQLQRHQQLQRQLERIQSDCAQMKHQMSEVQEATVEALEIGQGLQRGTVVWNNDVVIDCCRIHTFLLIPCTFSFQNRFALLLYRHSSTSAAAAAANAAPDANGGGALVGASCCCCR